MEKATSDFNLDLTVLTAKGLENPLLEEIEEILTDLRLPREKLLPQGAGAVSLKGNWETVAALNLCLRIGTRVLVGLHQGQARSLEDIHRQCLQLPWEEILPKKETFAVFSSVHQSRVQNSLMVNLKIKDAVADRFRQQTGSRPNVSRENPNHRIYARLQNNFLEVSLDTSGPSLSHRGHRVKSGMAPLREPTAAALLRLSGWNRLARAVGTGDLAYFERAKEREKTFLPDKIIIPPFFCDPMCGTGTLPIEAALILKGRFPAVERKDFPCLHLPRARQCGVENIFRELKEKVKKREWKDQVLKERVNLYLQRAGQSGRWSSLIRGNDLNREVLAAARENAHASGVDRLIQWTRQDATQLTVTDGPGLLLVNPPYGERLGGEDHEALSQLYGDLGRAFKKNFPGWMVWVLSGNEKAAKSIGLRATRRISLFNGAIPCRFQQYIIAKGTGRAQRIQPKLCR